MVIIQLHRTYLYQYPMNSGYDSRLMGKRQREDLSYTGLVSIVLMFWIQYLRNGYIPVAEQKLLILPEHLSSSWLAHLAFRPGELLSSLFDRRPSVNISHFNLLLRNHWGNCNQTLVEWSLDGPLPNLCPVIPISNQDGRQAKNRNKGG